MTTEAASATTDLERALNVNEYELELEDSPRSTVTVLGHTYELAEPDDFSYPTLKHINRMWKRVNQLDDLEDITDQQAEEYEQTLNAMLKLICPDLTQEVYSHKNFGRTDKSQIIIAFFLEAAQRMPLKVKQPLLITPSAESSDSTAEV